MKKTILSILLIWACSSCSVLTFYQTFSVMPTNGAITNNEITFEDSNCTLQYDLFSNTGKVSFSIYNKTDQNMVIDLTNTFFIINSTSTQYFQSRTFTDASSTYKEQPQIIIPAKTRIHLSQFSIIKQRFVSNRLAKFPTSQNFNKLSYMETDSPIKFSNLITYTVNNSTSRFENHFFISEIANYPSSNILYKITSLDNLDYKPKTHIPNFFYFRYTRRD